MEDEKKIKQRIIISIGAVAILAVAAITIYRVEKMNESDKTGKNAPAEESAPEYASLTGPELKEKIRKDEVQLIDVRTLAEFGLEHIIDSVNIPLEFLGNSSEITTDKDAVIIGPENEESAKMAVATLKSKGVRNVFLLQGGFVDWKAIGERTVTWGDLSSFQDQAKITFVPFDEFRKIIESGKPVTLIDARKNVFYKEGHIEGAVNIPLSEIEKRRGEIPSKNNILFYADNELEAFQAAVKLYDMKMVSAGVARGGLEAWKEKGYEIVK